MIKNIILHFDEGLPRTTAQQKGEVILYKNGRPFIHHYRKEKVENLRQQLLWMLKSYAPSVPSDGPVKLTILICFDIKDKKLWGKYKTTRPDGDNWVKTLKDVMTDTGFWNDDAQVVDERVIRTYAEKGSVRIQVEDLRQPGRLKT